MGKQGINNNALIVPDEMWDDLRVPISAIKVPAANNPTWTAYKGGQILAFSDQAVLGNEEIVYFVAQLPHSYKQGTDIEAHVHWVGEDNTAGNVRWLLTYSWANIGSVLPAESELTVNGANGGDTDEHNLSDFGFTTGAGKEISSMIICSLKRNSSNAGDTFTGKDAYLLEIDFHFQKNSLGSDAEQSKSF